jgi:hypothetical protein
MSRPIFLLTAIAVAIFGIGSLDPPAHAQAAAQPELTASPITPGFWIFATKKPADNSEVMEACHEHVAIQFSDGYYFGLKIGKPAPGASGPRLSAAIVDEIGYCTFDRQSQTERCDLAVTGDGGATDKGFIDVRYSTENGALKMTGTATTTDGPNAGRTEALERFPVQCPTDIVHDLMTVVRSKQ